MHEALKLDYYNSWKQLCATFIVQPSQDIVCIIREKASIVQNSWQHLSYSWTAEREMQNIAVMWNNIDKFLPSIMY